MRANWAAATEPPLPACPHCGGRDVECVGGRLWLCEGCAKVFVGPTPVKAPPTSG
jgi:ribosomal protein L37AE/L43A